MLACNVLALTEREMHHFIGVGLESESLREVARDRGRLTAEIGGLVSANGLQVVSDQIAEFDNGGLTVVWILAESHLVLHHWAVEGFATLDLHVCDYQGSNADKATSLVEDLSAYCFSDGAGSWREMHLSEPVRVPASA